MHLNSIVDVLHAAAAVQLKNKVGGGLLYNCISEYRHETWRKWRITLLARNKNHRGLPRPVLVL